MPSDKIPRQNRVREALGRIYEHEPPYFREYLRRFKEDPTSRVFAPLAEAYRRLGRIDEAIEICREGLDHHPDFHGGRVALAKCYIDVKRLSEARAELERVIRIVPENLLAQRLLGDTYLALGDTGSALHCYKMALLLSPNDVTLAEKVHQMERDTPAEIWDEASVTQASPSQRGLSRAETVRPKRASEQTTVSGVVGEAELAPLWGPQGPVDPMPASPNDSLDEELDALFSSPLPDGETVTSLASDKRDEADAVAGFSQGWPADDASESLPSTEDLGSETSAEIDRLLGMDLQESQEESFQIDHVSAVFSETPAKKEKEITTETLGDLYFSQGQFDKALRIFEKLAGARASLELQRKIDNCRARLGVDDSARIRNRKISVLKTVLSRVQKSSDSSAK